MTPLDMALSLASDGFPVFPCRRPDKRPTCPNGFYDATRDAAAVKQLWAAHPGNLIGVPTGSVSGLFVADIDSGRHASATEWYQQNQHRLKTRVHRTESGGLHLLFHHQPGLRNSQSRLAHGVDTRGEGGYIIWWPAAQVTQSSSGIDAPIEIVPEWITAKLRSPEPPRSRAQRYRAHLGSARDKVNGIVRTIVRAREGERNSLTFWAACRLAELAEDGVIGRDAAIDLAVAAATYTGLPENEAKRTVLSAFRQVQQ